METPRKRIFSGIQPSGLITLGNYLGALKNWVELQADYDCLYCVVDMHALTVRQDPADFRKRILSTFCQLLACGVDPENSVLYIQSHVPEHAELSWILNCYTMFGELSRMTQFKDKSAKNSDNINAGLFTYPVLMAADILLYNTDLVPVGEDQRQHLEIARDIAVRFNGIHGDTFVLPEGYIPKVGAKIMSLSDPSRKMSKSDDNPGSYVALMDSPDDIMRKFKRAVTDSGSEVALGEGKDGINNLMSIYSTITGRSFEQITEEFAGKGYGAFKPAVGEAVVECFRPIRERAEEFLKNRDYIEGLYAQNAQKASRIAGKTLAKVAKRVGYIAKARF